MAKIIYAHPGQSEYDYRIYTDLDFWDTRRILMDLAMVKRNYGDEPSGDDFPTQVVGKDLSRSVKQKIIYRLEKAIASPPRHVIVRAIMNDGFFEFDPSKYYPDRWPLARIFFFTFNRLPLEQSKLNSPYKMPRVTYSDGRIKVFSVQREEKFDPVIDDIKASRRRRFIPSCF